MLNFSASRHKPEFYVKCVEVHEKTIANRFPIYNIIHGYTYSLVMEHQQNALQL